MSTLRTKLVTAAAVTAAAVGGATIASAATSGTSTSGTTTATADNDHHGPHTVNGKSETALTGDVAAKVKAAALAKVPGTIERLETNVDSSAPYEAHITKSDGSEVEVQVNADYTVAAVNAMGH